MEQGTGVRERWLVVGAAGMLGQDMADAARAAGHEVTGTARGGRPAGGVRDDAGRGAAPGVPGDDGGGARIERLDVLDPAAVAEAVRGFDVVVNCAAWTAVDDAETHEAEAFAVNAVGAANVARACAAAGARLVHVSTDYVFDGAATSPYPAGAPVAPRSAYGRTKAAGEWAVRAEAPDAIVVRTAWLYGAGGGCFPRTMARLAREKELLHVVDDQVGQPTWTRDLADLVLRLVAAGAPGGIYHGTSSGEVSWFGFTERIVAAAGAEVKLEPTGTASFPRPAPRPAYSVLSHDTVEAAGVEPIGHWAERWERAAPEVLGA